MGPRRLYLAALLFLAAALFLPAQDAPQESDLSVRISRIQSGGYPNLKVYVSVENKAGEPNLSMVKGNFTVKVDTEDPVDSVRVDPFKYLEEPVHYVFLLSASGLMDGPPLAAQKEGVLAFAEHMRDSDTVSAYLAGDKLNELFSYARSTEIPEDVVRGIEVSESPVKIYDSVVNVARKVEKDKELLTIPPGDRVVFILISDGRDQESRYSLDQTLEVLNRDGIPVYSVGLRTLSSASLTLLNDLSNQSGGFYRFASSPTELDSNLDLLSEQILTAYVLQFKVRGVSADDSFHQLMVQVDNKNQSAQSFRNFLAYKTPFPLWMKIAILIGAVVVILILILLMILGRMRLRKSLGISKRRCPECKRRMKDDWEFCPFCRYLPPKKKRKKSEES
ncbi:MAG: hypothetical protein PQJ50_14135 [Spirochaetales bacterium]|nr:hypothetical protein [Spirochaetales bacterium]